MKKFILTCMFSLVCLLAGAQEYSACSAGQSNTGNFLVKIVVSSKKKLKSSSEDLVKHYAVHAVIFRGLMATDGYGEQKPLVKDGDVEVTQSEFFNAFWNDGVFKRFASLVPSTLSVMKNKQTKMTETSATVMVDKESLLHYLEESHIIQGFSNLW